MKTRTFRCRVCDSTHEAYPNTRHCRACGGRYCLKKIKPAELAGVALPTLRQFDALIERFQVQTNQLYPFRILTELRDFLDTESKK